MIAPHQTCTRGDTAPGDVDACRHQLRFATVLIVSVVVSLLFLPRARTETTNPPPPVLERSTFFGSSTVDSIRDVEADPGGNLVIVGRTHMFDPTDFPLRNAFQKADDQKLAPGLQGFVAKFSRTGDLVFSTYLGGERNDEASAVAVDRTGDIYVTGFTQSHIDFGGFALAEFNGFPTTPNAYITNGSVRFDHCIFLTRFDPAGGVVYSTLVTRDGGSQSSGQSVAVDATGHAYVAGTLESVPMTLPGSGTVLYSGAFLMKFKPEGSGTVYTNLIPGATGLDIAVEPDGTAHFVGRFSGSNLSTTPDAYDVPTGNGGSFYQKLSPDGTILYSSAFAPRNGSVRAVAVDAQGRALLVGGVGVVFGSLFPGHFHPVNPVQAVFGGGDADGFLARFDTRLSGTNAVDFATYLGGEGNDELTDVAIDSEGRIYATGNTSSTNLTVATSVSSRLSGGRDAFFVQLNPAVTGVEFAAHLGGSGWEIARGITRLANPPGFALAGDTLSVDFPVTNAFQGTFRGVETEGFLSKFTAATPTETLVVNSANDLNDGVCDSAHCSLREAIAAANARPGAQTITFNIPTPNPAPFTGPVIQPTNALPSLVDPVTIDGTTQPGGGWVVLDGTNAGPAIHGLMLDTTNCVIRGLTIHSFSGDGIRIFEGGRHTLMDLHIGTDIAGTNRLGNHGVGIHIIASPHNTITGGTELFRDTLVSGNFAEGIRIEDGYSVSNRIAEVRVGVDALGAPLGNGGAGIHLINAHHSEITNCVVSGNPETGIRLSGLEGARIAGCLIGRWSGAGDPFGIGGGFSPVPGNGRIGISLFDCTGVLVGGSRGNSVTADEVALRIERGASNRIEGNQIGSYLRVDHPSRPRFGIAIVNSTRNVIGGQSQSPGAAPGNVFAGNETAVYLKGTAAEGNVIRGNRFGGPSSDANTLGIRCAAPETIVGGETTADANFFTGDRGTAIVVESLDARGSAIIGNRLKAEPGTAPRQGIGIALRSTAEVHIGRPTDRPGQPPGNVVGGFSTGIDVASTTGSSIEGNLIGAVPDDPTTVANSNGIFVVAASANRIGGDEPNTANVIAGNAFTGIWLRGDDLSGAEANRITGNFIGVAFDGTTPAPNYTDGIALGSGARRTLVGVSPNPARGGRANVIAHNGGDGIRIDPLGAVANTLESRNLICRNRIFANGGLGIRSAAQGQFPRGEHAIVEVFSALSGGDLRSIAIVRVRGLRLGSVHRLEFFENDACDASGSGEGQRYLAAHDFVAVTEEQLVFAVLGADHPAGRFVTALLFDDRDNTSQFSACFKVVPAVDSDGDSIPDTIEEATRPDANGDGTPDKDQAHVTKTQSPGSSRPVVLTGPPGGTFSDVQTPATPPQPGQLPPGAQLPGGQLEFKFTVPSPPGPQSPGPVSVMIEVQLSSGTVPGAWFFYGPTPDDPSPHWQNFSHDGSTGAEIVGNIVRLHFIDGQRGDRDLEVNGVIDTSGAAVVLGGGEIRIREILPAGDDRFWISGTGSLGGVIALESSADLVQWHDEAEAAAPFGLFEFLASPAAEQQFFRVQVR